MELLNYPGRDEHIAAHNKFREELNNMLADESGHDAVSRQLISTFLREWLKRHIFGIDKELETFLLSHGVG